MAVACWAPCCSSVDSEGFVVSGRRGESDDVLKELVDIVAETVRCEKLDLWGGRSRRESLDHCVVGRGGVVAVAVVVRRKVKCLASFGQGL